MVVLFLFVGTRTLHDRTPSKYHVPRQYSSNGGFHEYILAACKITLLSSAIVTALLDFYRVGDAHAQV